MVVHTPQDLQLQLLSEQEQLWGPLQEHFAPHWQAIFDITYIDGLYKKNKQIRVVCLRKTRQPFS